MKKEEQPTTKRDDSEECPADVDDENFESINPTSQRALTAIKIKTSIVLPNFGENKR